MIAGVRANDCQIIVDKACGRFICVKLPDRPVHCECQGAHKSKKVLF